MKILGGVQQTFHPFERTDWLQLKAETFSEEKLLSYMLQLQVKGGCFSIFIPGVVDMCIDFPGNTSEDDEWDGDARPPDSGGDQPR